jgi:hypothetical protein
MTESDKQADRRLDAELNEMERHSARVEEDIVDTRKEWEHNQADSKVPGAVGEPASHAQMPPPEPDETD